MERRSSHCTSKSISVTGTRTATVRMASGRLSTIRSCRRLNEGRPEESVAMTSPSRIAARSPSSSRSSPSSGERAVTTFPLRVRSRSPAPSR
jgi:hypothetical protein